MAELRQFTAAEVPELLNLPGVGPVVAGTILLAWSHPGRVRSEAGGFVDRKVLNIRRHPRRRVNRCKAVWPEAGLDRSAAPMTRIY